MKKEIVAAVLLIILLIGSVYNIKLIDRHMTGLEDEVTTAYKLMQIGSFDEAQSKLETAIEHWTELDSYTHIFIRHTEIDSATDAFFTMLSDVAAEDYGSTVGSYGLLMAHLESLRTIEHISFGSIM